MIQLNEAKERYFNLAIPHLQNNQILTSPVAVSVEKDH